MHNLPPPPPSLVRRPSHASVARGDLPSGLSRLARLGVRPADSPGEVRRMLLTNVSAAIAVGLMGSFGVGYALTHLLDLAVIATGCTLLAGSALPMQSRGWRRGAVAATLLGPNLLVFCATLRLGLDTWFPVFFVLFAPVAFLLGATRPMRASLAALPAVLMAACFFLASDSPLALSPMVLTGLRLVSSASTIAVVAFLVNVFRADTAEAERLLSLEHDRSERLLRNVLPGPIAERLKADESAIAERFPEASVIFADLVGFTELSQRMTPERLVDMLNAIFSEFDRLSEVHGLEKIKTIGDCYMAAGGLVGDQSDHAGRTVAMGLDMLSSLARLNRSLGQNLALRIGVHTGPVVAGVIGRRKFIYDLWGDSVNTASRMESSGVAGRVQVSQSTADALGGSFELESRGIIQVKGKGAMETFLVAGRRGARL